MKRTAREMREMTVQEKDCYDPAEYIMVHKDHYADLKSEIEVLRNLVVSADVWVSTRRQRHSRKADTENNPYFANRHAQEALTCETWLQRAARFIPKPTFEPTPVDGAQK